MQPFGQVPALEHEGQKIFGKENHTLQLIILQIVNLFNY